MDAASRVHKGADFDEAARSICEEFKLPRIKAETLLEMELQLIDMKLYVEGVFGVDQFNRTYSEAHNPDYGARLQI